MRHFLFLPYAISLLWIIAGGMCRAQELTEIHKVTKLEAERPPLPVKLTGVVIDVSPQHRIFTLHDGAHSVGVHLERDIACPALGDTVEVTGGTFTHIIAGHSHPRVRAKEIHVTGSGKLPEVKPLPISELNRFEHFDQWVSVEGHVLRWKFRRSTNELIVVLVGPDSWTTAAVRVDARPDLATQLMGAKLRLTGINAGENTHDAFGALTVPSLSQLEILKPGSTDAFEAPPVSMQDVATHKFPAGARVKVRGTILARVGERVIYLRGEGGAQCNLLATPWPRIASDEEYVDAGAFPDMKPGDVVEMVGTQMQDSSDPELQKFALCYCHLRLVGSQPPPDPIPSTLEEIAAGKRTHDLVKAQATLTHLQQLPMQRGEWRTSLLLEADGVTMPLSYQAPGVSSFENLAVGDAVIVQALVDHASPNDPYQLQLLAPVDLKSLGVSAEVRSRQYRYWVGGGCLLLGLLLGWIAVLRRNSLRQARTAENLRMAHAAARESEMRWQMLFEQSPLSVQVFAPDGQTKRVNDAWMRLFRLTREQAYAFNPLHDPDLNASGAVELIRKAFAGEVVQVPPVPYPVSQDPPEHRWIGAVLYPLTDEAGRIVEVVAVHNDITKEKQAEDSMLALNQTLEQLVQERTAELRKAQSDLTLALDQERELGELKSRFVTMVSHEFRTPLGIIMSAIELLQNYEDRLPGEKRQELHRDIFSATRHMAGLMEQMLVLGRVEAGKVSCKTARCDLEILAGKLTDECLSATARKCNIAWTAEGSLSQAEADESLLRHIFSNLIHNAVKYSPAGGTVNFTIHREGTDAVFRVIDHGIGIPEADQKHLFEAFQRGSNVGDIPGTGLGLVIVKRCVELHGGTLHVNSTVGQGTVLTVKLPLFIG